MSDIMDRRIAKSISQHDERIDIDALGIDESMLRMLFGNQMDDLARLARAIDLLYPGEIKKGDAVIDVAIRLLERTRLV